MSEDFEINMFKVTALAVDLHTDQFRKHTNTGHKLPYVFHAFDVSKRLWRWGISFPIIQAAGLLHDTIEDAPDDEHAADARLRIEMVAGLDILTLVEELTCYGDKIKYMESFHDKSINAVIIKIADRLCNVEDFIQSNPDYAKKYFSKAEQVFNTFDGREKEIVSVFGEEVYGIIEKDMDNIYLGAIAARLNYTRKRM